MLAIDVFALPAGGEQQAQGGDDDDSGSSSGGSNGTTVIVGVAVVKVSPSMYAMPCCSARHPKQQTSQGDAPDTYSLNIYGSTQVCQGPSIDVDMDKIARTLLLLFSNVSTRVCTEDCQSIELAFCPLELSHARYVSVAACVFDVVLSPVSGGSAVRAAAATTVRRPRLF